MATPSLDRELRAKRSEMLTDEVESIALRLFRERGFADVTVEEIAGEARISVRTFYRYFTTKEEVLQRLIDRRTAALVTELSARPADEPPLHSVRVAFVAVVSAEDLAVTRRWCEVVADTPALIRGVVGGILMKSQQAITEFLAVRLELPSDALVPTMLAAAACGVIQAAQTRWFLEGGDLAAGISNGLEVLEGGAWST